MHRGIWPASYKARKRKKRERLAVKTSSSFLLLHNNKISNPEKTTKRWREMGERRKGI